MLQIAPDLSLPERSCLPGAMSHPRYSIEDPGSSGFSESSLLGEYAPQSI